MTTYIVSDVHLGNRHSRVAAFLAFLQSLPPDATLVLNGDTLDSGKGHFPAEHARVLDHLRAMSRTQTVIWLPGNHDEHVTLPDPAGIVFRDDYTIGQRLYVAHGHRFDNILVKHRPLFTALRVLHDLRAHLGLPAMHVAYFAKQLPWLYRRLCRHIANNAVEHAREQGFAATTCGHVHFAEDIRIGGIRYLNTGSWTEEPLHTLVVDETDMRLVPVPAAVTPRR